MNNTFSCFILSVILLSCTSVPDTGETQQIDGMYIHKVEPSYGYAGDEICLKGVGFSSIPQDNVVTFSGISAQVTSASSVLLKVIAPEHKTGISTVRIETDGKVASRDFYYLNPQASGGMNKYPQTHVGRELESAACLEVKDVLWDTTSTVTTGLDYYKLQIHTVSEDLQNIYMLKADLSKNIELIVSVPSTTTSKKWTTQTLTTMTQNLIDKDVTTYAMINGDFWQTTSPIKPRGPVHSSGKVWSSLWNYDPKLYQQALSYVGITNDGKMTIAPRDNYSSAQNSLRECTGAGVIMILDSEIQDFGTMTARDPRTAIGYTSDKVVWMLTVDGRHGTKGMTYSEMASIFFALGCESAVNLDGGGSAQMLVRNPMSLKHEICNWPSDPNNGDGGNQRAVINGWAIVKK